LIRTCQDGEGSYSYQDAGEGSYQGSYNNGSSYSEGSYNSGEADSAAQTELLAAPAGASASLHAREETITGAPNSGLAAPSASLGMFTSGMLLVASLSVLGVLAAVGVVLKRRQTQTQEAVRDELALATRSNLVPL
jgi:hypothetical protein